MVPTMLQRIARIEGIEARDFSTIDAILYGGAPIAPWVVERWLDLVGPEHFFFSYGGSQGIGLVIGRGDGWLTHRGLGGCPASCSLRIQDADGNELPTGEIGEIYLRQDDGVETFEYVGAEMPPATPDGYRTFGDLGWVDADGYLYIADRPRRPHRERWRQRVPRGGRGPRSRSIRRSPTWW